VSYRLGSPLGYVELERRGDVVEIAYFGVLAEARGRGVGRHLLAHAVRRGLALGAVEVRVETCSLDGPGALATYRGAGFIVVSEHVERRALHPDPGPW
jgi:ribosomal protein S18 acetylase RimI-like enzyme